MTTCQHASIRSEIGPRDTLRFRCDGCLAVVDIGALLMEPARESGRDHVGLPETTFRRRGQPAHPRGFRPLGGGR